MKINRYEVVNMKYIFTIIAFLSVFSFYLGNRSYAIKNPVKTNLSDSIGYHNFHPHREINYQLNRCLEGGREQDLMEIAPNIKNFTDWKREMLIIAEKALKEKRLLNAAFYYRYSCFFANQEDPDRLKTYLIFTNLINSVYQNVGLKRYEILYDHGYLPVLRSTPYPNKGTIILTSGFDSYLEEYIPRILYFASAGYDVIAFNGPGQGETLIKYKQYMTPEWEKPMGTILDYFKLDNVTAIGISLGGYLAVRAAAFDTRIKRVVAFDVMYDFYDCMAKRNTSIANILLETAFTLKFDFLIDAIMRQRMKDDMQADWFIRQGMIVTGQNSPAGFLRECRKYNLKNCSNRLKQDMLILAGSEDYYVPLSQFYQQIAGLVNAKSITGRIFTKEEQAQNHCQYGNSNLAHAFILNWINQISKQ